jgi:chromosome segregation ATPase
LNDEKNKLTETTNQLQAQIKQESDAKKKSADENAKLKSEFEQKTSALNQRIAVLETDNKRLCEEAKKIKENGTNDAKNEVESLKKQHKEELTKKDALIKQAQDKLVQEKSQLEQKFTKEKDALVKELEDRYNREKSTLAKELDSLREQLKAKEQQDILDVFKKRTSQTSDSPYPTSQYSSFAFAALSVLQEK